MFVIWYIIFFFTNVLKLHIINTVEQIITLNLILR